MKAPRALAHAGARSESLAEYLGIFPELLLTQWTQWMGEKNGDLSRHFCC